MAVLGRNALGVELDAVDWQRRVAKTHHRAVIRGCVDDQVGLDVLDDQRMIASRGKGRGEAFEQARCRQRVIGEVLPCIRPPRTTCPPKC